ncbi:2-haloacrylate reductase, partial [Mucuna pruriens]
MSQVRAPENMVAPSRSMIFAVELGHTILVPAAAGGVGSLLCQWANTLGATVVGTVSNKVKATQAKEDGCHHVIIYTEEDFVARVNEITSGIGVEVVYDSVVKDTFEVVPVICYYA